jgi:hypothetical protein
VEVALGLRLLLIFQVVVVAVLVDLGSERVYL